jgi:hypothetical protein
MQREVHDILGAIGLDEKTTSIVAAKLRQVEMDARGVQPGSHFPTSCE